IEVTGGVGSPPAPSYLWDLLLEVAQVRLHDGGIAEGEGDVEFTLANVPIGTDTATIEQTMRENLAADPKSLLDVANTIIDGTSGEADFYYFRTEADADAAIAGDWLFFLVEGDIPRGDDGALVRAYDYARPGFFSDESLTQRVSSLAAVGGDVEHEKVRIAPGDVLFVEGTGGAVYRIDVGAKPSLARVALTVTRVR
ncbi:MAG: acetyltransferase, partial [Polyangiaceae bacterium]|nr:acetyltransferase [Polyangiaceae bacterium]